MQSCNMILRIVNGFEILYNEHKSFSRDTILITVCMIVQLNMMMMQWQVFQNVHKISAKVVPLSFQW